MCKKTVKNLQYSFTFLKIITKHQSQGNNYSSSSQVELLNCSTPSINTNNKDKQYKNLFNTVSAAIRFYLLTTFHLHTKILILVVISTLTTPPLKNMCTTLKNNLKTLFILNNAT